MKALVKLRPGVGHVELRDVEEPRCGRGQVKIEVDYCGICGTDLHVVNDSFRNYPPVVLGHEISGHVVETGEVAGALPPGTPVAVLGATAVTCGNCVYCRAGHFMFCPDRRGMGHGVDGGFARYLVARPDQLFRLPENVSAEEGALCEPFAAAVHAVLEQTEVHAGDVVLISGPGPIGLLCLKLLVSLGVKTIVTGTSSDSRRLRCALEIGAFKALRNDAQLLAEAVKDETDGFGVDIAFECAGAADSIRSCLDALRPLGRYVQVGHFGREVMVPFDRIGFKQLQASGSVGYTRRSWERTIDILSQGRIRLADLITHRLPLSRWQEGFHLCEGKEALKVLLSTSEPR